MRLFSCPLCAFLLLAEAVHLSLLALQVRMAIILLHLLPLRGHLGQIFLGEDHLGAGRTLFGSHGGVIKFYEVWQCLNHELAVERVLAYGVVPEP
jgi:hypothetical protein